MRTVVMSVLAMVGGPNKHVRLCSGTLGFLALFGGLAQGEPAESGATTAEPLVLFNHDAGAGALTQYEPPITDRQLCRQLNELEGTSVNVFLFCCNIGGDMFLYPTKVGEPCGAKVTDLSKVHKHYREEMRRTAGNLKHIQASGTDPIKIVRRRAHELGMKFWITMRMNEIHEDDVRWRAMVSQFKMDNRHLLLQKEYPLKGYTGYAKTFGYSYAWDYGRKETRDHILAVLREMLDRYELDGLELDFMRHPMFFRRGQQNASLMTDFVRKVRAEVNRVSKEKKRKIHLAVRVYPHFSQNEQIGLDPRVWIKEELVDLVTPMDVGYTDMQPNLREFVQAARGTGVKIAGGLEGAVRDYGGHLSKQQAFAAASAFLEQGAQAIYFFNYDCHRREGRTNQYTAEEMEILFTIGHPKKYVRSDKHYFVTRSLDKPEERGRIQLPAELKPGKPREFTFTVGDDLADARRHKALASVRLSVTLSGYDPKAHQVAVRLNGKSPDPEHFQVDGQTLRWTNPPARRGENTLAIGLRKQAKATAKSVKVEKIELKVDYR